MVIMPRASSSTTPLLLGVLAAVGIQFLSPSGAFAQIPVRDAVADIIDGFHEALAAQDSARALTYLAEDVAILESGGVENLEHYRSGHLASDMAFASGVKRQRDDLTIHVLGDAAWAYSSNVTRGRFREREINSRGAELMVLARENGEWRIRAIHWSSRRR